MKFVCTNCSLVIALAIEWVKIYIFNTFLSLNHRTFLIIMVVREGEMDGLRGIFPRSYVRIIKDTEHSLNLQPNSYIHDLQLINWQVRFLGLAIVEMKMILLPSLFGSDPGS